MVATPDEALTVLHCIRRAHRLLRYPNSSAPISPRRLGFPATRDCAITEGPWNLPVSRKSPLRQRGAWWSGSLARQRSRQAKLPLTTRKMPHGIALYVRSGWSRDAASWFATCAGITCPARTTT